MYKVKSTIELSNELYIKVIRKLVKFLVKYDLYLVACVIPTLLAEPISVIQAAFLRIFGLKRNFNWYGCNPQIIEPNRVHMNPVLLIHGDYDKQSTWIKFVKALQKEGIPAFTINLPKEKELHPIKLEKKWNEIEKIYLNSGRSNVKINVAGHSIGAGSDLAMLMGIKKSSNSGNIIMIGGHLDTHDKNNDVEQAGIKSRIHEILGAHDIFLDVDTNFVPERRSVFECGHLNLLLNEEVHQKLIEILKD